MMLFAERFKQARKDKQMTQKAFADFLGVNLRYISRWENGGNTPELETAMQIAKRLNVSLDYLVGLDGNNKNSALQTLILSKVDKLSNEQQNALKTIIKAF